MLSIIIVSYNVKPYLEKCLNSISQATLPLKKELIIIDNNSQDGTTQLIKNNFPQVILIENQQNVGFSAAVNQGLKKAGGNYFLLINPDTIVQQNTISILVEYLKNNSDVGVVTCKILNPNGTLQPACRRSIPTPRIAFYRLIGLSHLFPQSKTFGRYNLTYADENALTEVEAVSGSFMLFRREVYEDVGEFDADFFMYAEDLDYCCRVRQAGWRIVYHPQTRAVHFKGSSARLSPYRKIFQFNYSMYLFTKKYYKLRYGFFPFWLMNGGILINALVSLVFNFFKFTSKTVSDFILINISLSISLVIWFGYLEVSLPYQDDFVLALILHGLASLAWIFSFNLFKLYDRPITLLSSLGGCVSGFFIFTGALFYFRQIAFSRIAFLVTGSLIFIFKIVLEKWTIKSTTKNILIVGDQNSGQRIYQYLVQTPNEDYHILGYVEKMGGSHNGNYLGPLDDLKKIISEKKVHEILIDARTNSYQAIIDILPKIAQYPIGIKLVSEITRKNKTVGLEKFDIVLSKN